MSAICASNRPSVFGIGDHEHGRAVVELGLQVVHVDAAPGVLLMVTASKPAMAALAGLVPWALSGMSTRGALLAAVAKIGGGDQQGGQLALGTGGRLQRDGVEPGDLGQDVLHLVEQFAACPGTCRRSAADAGRPCPAARPAVRSAWGCTSSCTSRADRNCVSTDMFRVDRLAKWRIRSISADFGQRRRRRRPARRPAAAPRPARRARRTPASGCARRPGWLSLEQQFGRLVLRMIRCCEWSDCSCKGDATLTMGKLATFSRTLRLSGQSLPCCDVGSAAGQRGQAVDLAARPLLGHGHQEAIGQFGIPAAQRHAGDDSRRPAASASSSRHIAAGDSQRRTP